MISNGHLVLNGMVNEARNSFSLTRLFIRADLGLDKVRKLPGVENAILQNNGTYKLWLAAASYGQEVLRILPHREYLQTLDQEPPTLDEIFKLKAGENNE